MSENDFPLDHAIKGPVKVYRQNADGEWEEIGTFEGPLGLFPPDYSPSLGGQPPPDSSPRLGGKKAKIQCECGRWYPDEMRRISVFELLFEIIKVCELCWERRRASIEIKVSGLIAPEIKTYLHVDGLRYRVMHMETRERPLDEIEK